MVIMARFEIFYTSVDVQNYQQTIEEASEFKLH